MTTITFNENIHFSKQHFETLENFQLYVVQKLQKADLPLAHKEILDQRLKDAEENPEDFVTLDALKSSIKRI